MRTSIPDRYPELFRKGASVVRTPEWRRIHARMLQEIERLGLTVDEVAIGMDMGRFPGLLRKPDRPISTNTLYWLARAGADISFVLAGETARHRISTQEAA